MFGEVFLNLQEFPLEKKVAIIFGVYGKSVYLCTRFREARPFEAARNVGGRKKSSLKVLHKERK